MTDAPPSTSPSPHQASPHQSIVCVAASSRQGANSVQYLGLVTGEAILGANAVIDADLDYETVGQPMLMVSASGTAVIVR